MIMRTGNFARPLKPRVRLVAGFVWSGIAILAGVQFWLLQDTEKLKLQEADMLQRSEALQLKYVNMEAAIETIPPSVEVTRQLVTRIENFNTLSRKRAAPVLAVFELLESHVPDKVWLQQLSYDVETGRLQVALISEQENLLPSVLKTLENTKELSNVILERQIRRQGGKSGLIQYDVQAMVN